MSRHDGINVDDSEGVDIVENLVAFSGSDGIDVNRSRDAEIKRNLVILSGDNGIAVNDSRGVDIKHNIVGGSFGNGIKVERSYNADVIENIVLFSGDNGIAAYYNGSVNIDGNLVGFSANDGIHVEDAGFIAPTFSLLGESRSDVYLRGPSNARIVNNIVGFSGDDGIEARNVSGELIVDDNFVINSFRNGVKVSGLNNGYVSFHGNALTDNGQDSGSAAARFESGDIDLSDLDRPNTFINTTGLAATALQFDGAPGFGGDDSDGPQSDRIDSFPTGNGLRIVGETLGSTVFDGYTAEGSFYVRFEDGSILDPISGAPIVIDGTEASFDGIIPSSFAGAVLPVATLNFIEDRLYDADDETTDGRGQIFVGTAPVVPAGLVVTQQILPQEIIDGPVGDSRASVVITSLPLIDGLDGLNDIEPASGEGEQDGLNEIEPAAGEGSAEVTCIGDALSSLSSGSVTYNFGGSFEDSMASELGCASEALAGL